MVKGLPGQGGETGTPTVTAAWCSPAGRGVVVVMAPSGGDDNAGGDDGHGRPPQG